VDTTIVKFDSTMVAMREGVYSDYEYLLHDATRSSNITKGGYCISDNGYLRLPTMMAPRHRIYLFEKVDIEFEIPPRAIMPFSQTYAAVMMSFFSSFNSATLNSP
jgi:hypothetical protein